MGNPPPAVKLALESICLLLGEQATDWRTLRGVIIKDNFISTVVNFSTDDITYVNQLDFMFTCHSKTCPSSKVQRFSIRILQNTLKQTTTGKYCVVTFI